MLFGKSWPESMPYESNIYGKLRNWICNEELLEDLRDKIRNASGDYKIELIKRYRKMDFLRTFIIICKLATENIMVEPQSRNLIHNIVGSVMGRLIFETSNIEDLRKIIKNIDNDEGFKSWVDNRREGKIWVKGTFLENKIDELFRANNDIKIGKELGKDDWDITLEDYAKYEFALISGSSYTDLESMMARGISRTSLCNILYGFIFIRRLIESLYDDFLLNWHTDEDLITGNSGINHFFDGLILLCENDKNNPWLLKCISMCHNPLQSIESIESKLDDINATRCILFLPMYPSQSALRYSVHIYAKKNFEIIILYLDDLYNILNMSDSEIKAYLGAKRI